VYVKCAISTVDDFSNYTIAPVVIDVGNGYCRSRSASVKAQRRPIPCPPPVTMNALPCTVMAAYPNFACQ
jgi:hypothetical protein